MADQKSLVALSLFAFLIFVFTFVPTIKADSVYAIPKHWDTQESTLNVYDILEDGYEGQLKYRATYDLAYLRPTDVTIDTQSDILFVTFEFQEVVELINARTFLSEGVITADEATDLAGVVLDYIDPDTVHLYTVDRGTKNLFVYDWDAGNKELTLIPPDPNTGNDYYELQPEDPGSDPSVHACGLALDGQTGLLYVSQYDPSYSSVIQVYDPDDNFSHVRTIDLNDAFDGDENYAVDIDIDSANGWLYAGGYKGHRNLIRFDLDRSDPNGSDFGDGIKEIVPEDEEEEEDDNGVIGLAVSPGTSFVYMTTYNLLLEAWNTDLPYGLGWTRIDEEEVDAGGGVCVADVDYVPPFGISKVDDVNEVTGCVVSRPGEEITYTIKYEYNWTEPGDPNVWNFTGIVITDDLPREVDFISADPDVGYYNAFRHTYIWEIDPDSVGDPNSIDILVEINNKVMPGEEIENSVVQIYSDINGQEYTAIVEIETLICPCDDWGKIIYVDKDATNGSKTGESWTNAYLTIEEALDDAFPCDEVWVAEGIYKPTAEPNMVNYVGVYGGFEGGVSGESERYERDWSVHEAIICADTNDDDDLTKGFNDPNRNTDDNLNFAVVANDYIKWAVLGGFTIRRGWFGGVFCNGSSVLIEHNKIIDNGVGIYCEDTDVPLIRNNWIYDNGTGIYMNNAVSAGVIRNNTIVYNNPTGIYVESGIKPLISNCILWGHADANDIVGGNATYSCIEYPKHYWDETDPDNPIYLGIGQGNISGEANDPLFVDAGNDDYHLDPNSPCINAGDPNFVYTGNERDIDKHFRVICARVDIGGDEYYEESDADFTEDSIVNMLDFDEFSAAWLIDSTDPNWSDKYSKYDLCGDGDAVDVNDLLVFAEDWLWMECDAMKDVPVQESMAMGMYEEMSKMSSLRQTEALSSEKLSQEPLSIKERIAQAEELVTFLERIWEEDEEVRKTIDIDDWNEFIKTVYNWLDELEMN